MAAVLSVMPVNHPSREPELSFDGLVLSAPPASVSRARRWPLVVTSLSLHGLLLGALGVGPVLFDRSLPEPQATVRAFFVSPEMMPAAPPPPPPAPAAAARSAAADSTRRVAERGLVAPVEIPDEIAVPDAFDLGLDGLPGGAEGGVEGGVAGGVPGAVVGGLLATAPKPRAPIRVGGGIREPRKLVHVDPVYPALALQARVQGAVVIECLVSPRGTVSEAKVLQSIPLLDKAALEAVRLWRYTPTLFEGLPVPVIMTVTVTFHLR